jgi:hypothetical protein
MVVDWMLDSHDRDRRQMNGTPQNNLDSNVDIHDLATGMEIYWTVMAPLHRKIVIHCFDVLRHARRLNR